RGNHDVGPAQLLAGPRRQVDRHDLVERVGRTLAQFVEGALLVAEQALLRTFHRRRRLPFGQLDLELFAQRGFHPAGTGLFATAGHAPALPGLAWAAEEQDGQDQYRAGDQDPDPLRGQLEHGAAPWVRRRPPGGRLRPGRPKPAGSRRVRAWSRPTAARPPPWSPCWGG